MVFHEARGYARSRTKPLPSPPPILSPPFSCFEFGRECDSWFIRFSDWWARRVECQEMTKIIIIRGATLVRETISPACRVYSIVFLYICVCIRDIDGHPFDINWTRNHCPVPRSHPWSPNWQNPNSLVSPIKIRPGNIVIHPPPPPPRRVISSVLLAPRVTDSFHNNFAFPFLLRFSPPFLFTFLSSLFLFDVRRSMQFKCTWKLFLISYINKCAVLFRFL